MLHHLFSRFLLVLSKEWTDNKRPAGKTDTGAGLFRKDYKIDSWESQYIYRIIENIFQGAGWLLIDGV